MDTIDDTIAVTTANDDRTPALIRTIDKKTYEVYVYFSDTSTETFTDKIMRLIRNEVSFWIGHRDFNGCGGYSML